MFLHSFHSPYHPNLHRAVKMFENVHLEKKQNIDSLLVVYVAHILLERFLRSALYSRKIFKTLFEGRSAS